MQPRTIPQAIEDAAKAEPTRGYRFVPTISTGTDETARMKAAAASYPEAKLDHPWGEDVFKVGRKVFVFFGVPGDDFGLSVKLPHSAGAALMLPFLPTECQQSGAPAPTEPDPEEGCRRAPMRYHVTPFMKSATEQWNSHAYRRHRRHPRESACA